MNTTSAATLRIIDRDELNYRRLLLAAIAIDPAALAAPVEDLPAIIATAIDSNEPGQLRGALDAAIVVALAKLHPEDDQQ
ncbi:hypothetical protein KE423_003900 [Salmonella enterica]|nr:hypothetical protein [Salmonella enterica]